MESPLTHRKFNLCNPRRQKSGRRPKASALSPQKTEQNIIFNRALLQKGSLPRTGSGSTRNKKLRRQDMLRRQIAPGCNRQFKYSADVYHKRPERVGPVNCFIQCRNGRGSFRPRRILLSVFLQTNTVFASPSNNGVAKSPATYTISNTGMVTFLDIPVSGNVIQWSGAWYYRCRFTDDTLDFDEFAHYFWDAKKVAFRGSLSGKI